MALSHLSAVTGAFGKLFAIILPFVYGICIAYVLNMPYEFFRVKVFGALDKKSRKITKWINTLALATTYVTVFVAVTMIVWFVIPQLGNSVNRLVQNIPAYLSSVQEFVNNMINSLSLGNLLSSQASDTWTNILQKAATMLSSLLQNVVNYLLGLTSSIYNWIIGFIFSIYMLIGKDTLQLQMKRFLKAFLSEKKMNLILNVTGLTNTIFSSFIKGSLIDSMIVGVICFLGMSILGIPFALLVSVIQGLTNIIPVFGPVIGAVPSTFIILMDDPVKALVFVVFIIFLQQLDGNIIQPRIVGNAIGLPGIWVLLSIIVGSGILGMIGLIIGVPIAAVLYALLKETVNNRLKNEEKSKEE